METINLLRLLGAPDLQELLKTPKRQYAQSVITDAATILRRAEPAPLIVGDDEEEPPKKKKKKLLLIRKDLNPGMTVGEAHKGKRKKLARLRQGVQPHPLYTVMGGPEVEDEAPASEEGKVDEADDSGEHWITTNGHHVLIGGQREFSFIHKERDLAKEANKGKTSPSAKDAQGNLENAVLSGSSSEESLGGGVSETQRIEFEDGTVGVFKPGDGEGGTRTNITRGYQTEREVGAWEVAKVVGMDDLVTPTIATEIDGREGALLAWRDGTEAMNLSNSEMYDGSQDLQRGAMFDYVIGNEDRHSGNWMVEEGKLQLIDHGLSFPDKKGDAWGNRQFVDQAKENFGSYDVKELATPYIEAQSKIAERLSAIGLPSGSIDGVNRRIEFLKENTTSAFTWENMPSGAGVGRESTPSASNNDIDSPSYKPTPTPTPTSPMSFPTPHMSMKLSKTPDYSQASSGGKPSSEFNSSDVGAVLKGKMRISSFLKKKKP